MLRHDTVLAGFLPSRLALEIVLIVLLQIVVSHSQLLFQFRCYLQERFHYEIALIHQRVGYGELGCIHDQVVIQKYVNAAEKNSQSKHHPDVISRRICPSMR